MNEAEQLLKLNADTEKEESSKVVLMVDGKKITDPKEIVAYVEENMGMEEEEEQEEEVDELMTTKSKKESDYVPGSMKWD